MRYVEDSGYVRRRGLWEGEQAVSEAVMWNETIDVGGRVRSNIRAVRWGCWARKCARKACRKTPGKASCCYGCGCALDIHPLKSAPSAARPVLR